MRLDILYSNKEYFIDNLLRIGDITVVIKIAGKTFKSKGTLINYVKYVLNNHEVGTSLGGDWFDVVDGVLRLHTNYKQKVGDGKYEIYIQQCTVNPRNRNFMIRREDDSTTDFSYYKALRPDNKASDVKAALRYAIQDQCVEYKDNYFLENASAKGRVICAETGLKVTKKTSHLDHYPVQFDEIVSTWFKLHKLKLSDIELKDSWDNKRQSELADAGLVEYFQTYHEEVANYRVVLAGVNLQRKKAKVTKLEDI